MTFSPEMSQQASHTPMKFSKLSVLPFYICRLHRGYFSSALERLPSILPSDQSTVIESRCIWHLKYTS